MTRFKIEVRALQIVIGFAIANLMLHFIPHNLFGFHIR